MSVNMIFRKRRKRNAELMGKMGRRLENSKKLYNNICRTKMDYGCQLYNTASAGTLKKLDSIHRESIRINIATFRTSPVEALHVKARTHPWN